MEQLTLDAHARISDPISSERAVRAIAKNGTIKHLVIEALVFCSIRQCLMPDNQWVQMYDKLVTDDMILAYVEEITDRRQQRNVIARTRGLLERAGYCTRVPDDLMWPDAKLSFIPTNIALTHCGISR